MPAAREIVAAKFEPEKFERTTKFTPDTFPVVLLFDIRRPPSGIEFAEIRYVSSRIPIMRPLMPEEALAYLNHWELVLKAEIAELRQVSSEAKFRQLSALVDARNFFPEDPRRQEEVEAVRRRWARVRMILGG